MKRLAADVLGALTIGLSVLGLVTAMASCYPAEGKEQVPYKLECEWVGEGLQRCAYWREVCYWRDTGALSCFHY